MSFANFTSESARSALTEILDVMNCPENISKLSEAKDSAGNEMLKMMQFIFPLVMQIQMQVLKNYGFPEGREGIVQFAQMVREFEREDSEIASLHNQIRAFYMPPVAISAVADASL